MNITNKMTNVDHRNILMYIIRSFINDLEKDARKSSLRYSNQVLKNKCFIKRVRASITQNPINKTRSNTFYSMIKKKLNDITRCVLLPSIMKFRGVEKMVMERMVLSLATTFTTIMREVILLPSDIITGEPCTLRNEEEIE